MQVTSEQFSFLYGLIEKEEPKESSIGELKQESSKYMFVC
jgi:hypothetical protein